MMRPDKIEAHHYYSNGAYGRAWGVRLVTGIDGDEVRFKGVAGQCRRKTGHCPHAEFATWAKYEVALNENSWQRVEAASSQSE